jgi:superfamily II DNA/RNA helicase
MTGQGKTLAYLLPILANIDRSVPRIQAMIVLPTRELAVQVSRVLHELAAPANSRQLPLAVATLLGEAANPSMLSALVRAAKLSAPTSLSDEGIDPASALLPQHHPHMIVAQAGAAHDVFCAQALSDVRQVLPLTHLKYLVFDEADALLNAQATRNLVLPLIGLRHQSSALALEHVLAEQAHLDATREERRRTRSGLNGVDGEMQNDEAAGEQVQQEQDDDAEQPPQQQQQDTATSSASDAGAHTSSSADAAAVSPSSESTSPSAASPASSSSSEPSSVSAPSSSSSPPASPSGPALPRNQVVLVSATITPAVHQFAARFLSPSRAFLTSQSIAGERERLRALKNALATSGADVVQGSIKAPDALQPVASSSSPSAPRAAVANRMPSHLRHYYLLVNRPYDRQNSLQQLLQAIKLQFERWKKTALGLDDRGADVAALGAKPPSASWIAKHLLGPQRAQSAGGVAPSNKQSPVKYLRGGVASLGVGARAALMQTTLVFLSHRSSIAPLVNPLSQQGFNVGVVSEHSGRHERREGLQLHKGVELVLATDVLARGMDLKALTHVVNWDIPSSATNYLHRAGRVGRLGAVHARLGTVITLVNLQRDPRALEHLSKMCATLSLSGPEMRMQRLYVKKGQIFEDVDETHDVTPTHAPDIAEFVVDKQQRQAHKQAELAERKAQQQQQQRDAEVAEEALESDASAAGEEGAGTHLFESVDPLETRSAARRVAEPLFGDGGLDVGSVAALELAQGGGDGKKNKKKQKETKLKEVAMQYPPARKGNKSAQRN